MTIKLNLTNNKKYIETSINFLNWAVCLLVLGWSTCSGGRLQRIISHAVVNDSLRRGNCIFQELEHTTTTKTADSREGRTTIIFHWAECNDCRGLLLACNNHMSWIFHYFLCLSIWFKCENAISPQKCEMQSHPPEPNELSRVRWSESEGLRCVSYLIQSKTVQIVHAEKRRCVESARCCKQHALIICLRSPIHVLLLSRRAQKKSHTNISAAYIFLFIGFSRFFFPSCFRRG